MLDEIVLIGPDNIGNDVDYDAWAKVAALIKAANAGQMQGAKNAIMNGDFNIWQRGSSFTAAANQTYFSDRWQYWKAGAAVHDVARSADVPSVAQCGRLIRYSAHLACTTADTSIATNDYSMISHKIEGWAWGALAQRPIVLSFWVKGTKTGVHYVALQNANADRSFVAPYTINASDTWERKEIAIPASPSAGTWNYTNGIGVSIWFVLACGATWGTDTFNAWQAANRLAGADQVNATDNTANNFRIAGVQLEAGSIASAFETKPFIRELEECQRYFEKSFAYDTAPAQNLGNNLGEMKWQSNVAGANAIAHYEPFKVRKRATPTMTFYNIGASNSEMRNVTDSADCSGTTANNANERGFGVTATGNAGLSVGEFLGVHWTASAEL